MQRATMFFKTLVVIGCLAVLATGKYTDKYDNINIKEILENERLLEAYFKCIMGEGKCTPDGKELKDNLIDAMETGCEQCTEVQKNGSVTIIEHLIQHKREYWNQLCEKYDPQGIWRKKYEAELREKGIEIPKD